MGTGNSKGCFVDSAACYENNSSESHNMKYFIDFETDENAQQDNDIHIHNQNIKPLSLDIDAAINAPSMAIIDTNEDMTSMPDTIVATIPQHDSFSHIASVLQSPSNM